MAEPTAPSGREYVDGNGNPIVWDGEKFIPGASVPPTISDQEILAGLIALGYTTEDAINLFSDNPDLALTLVQGQIGPSGGGVGGGSSGGGGGGGGGSDNTVGLAQVDLGYANLAQDKAQFDASFAEGQRQFDLTYNRSAFQSDREYELAKQQFAQTFAENQRQFDLGYGLDNRALDLQGELGRGNLALGRDQLGLDRELGVGRLNLDTELGRGRLALDTELGRGELGLGRDRLALDDRLGTGRLNLDTELGRGQLGVNQQGEQRLQRAQVAAERLANRDQELQRTQFVTDVLRKPSDFLARAFLQRGGTSPTGMVTQADIINNLKSSINQFAEGGYTRDGVFTTGEQGGSKSTEMLFNPTNAPIAIMNPQQTQSVMGRLGTQQQNDATIQPVPDQAPLGPRAPWMMGQNPGTPQIPTGAGTTPWGGPMPGIGQSFGDNPQFMEWYNNLKAQRAQGMLGRLQGFQQQQMSANPQVAQIMQQLPERMQGRLGIPGYADGTLGGGGGTNWYNPQAMQPGSTPNWDTAYQATTQTINPITMPNVTQDQLVNTGLSVLPPAVKGALFGRAGDIPPARPVGNLTLGRLGRLTPGELEALNTQLGVQFNTDLQNEMALLQERFGPVVNRARGRLVTQ